VLAIAEPFLDHLITANRVVPDSCGTLAWQRMVFACLQPNTRATFAFGGLGMATELTDEQRLKEVVKSAIVEVLEERKDLVREVIEEALEDAALARAIEEGDRPV
jgi:hypothetical protein